MYVGGTEMSMELLKNDKPMCTSEVENIKFSGSDNASYLMQRPVIRIKKCHGENCVTEDEINNFVKDKYLRVFVLSKSYDTTNYDPN